MSNGDVLSQTDTIMWTAEADPLLRSTILGVMLFDALPDWDALRERVAYAVERVPALRRVVAPVPLRRSALRWADVDRVDLDHHLRRVGAPGDRQLADVLHLACLTASAPFDRDRPLWEFTLVEGVDGDGAALLLKAHHVVTDGIGSVQLAAHLFDFEPDAPPRTPLSQAADPTQHSTWRTLLDSMVNIVDHDITRAGSALGSAVPALFRTAAQAMRDPIGTARDTARTAASIARVVTPVFSTRSPLMSARSIATRYGVLDLDLGELRAAAARHDGTLNDAFLAGITGGLRRYHVRHGQPVEDLRVAMPISLRAGSDDPGGNHITILRFIVPTADVSAAERVRAMHELGSAIRHERSLAHTESIAGVLNLMPRGVIGSMMKKVDFLASNVPGVPVPMYLVGQEVRRYFPFGPTAGSAVNITLMSYNGRCCIGVHTDQAAIPDHDEFIAHLAAGFDDVLALAR